MKSRIFTLALTASALTLSSLAIAQEKTPPPMKPEATEFYTPVPPKVIPGANNTAPPSDAIVLFDGKNLNGFASAKDGKTAAGWSIENGELVVTKGKGDIVSKQAFGDAQYHIEWSSPTEIVGEGQGRGNSGFFLMGMYEVQILDSYESKTYTNGQAGSIYKQHPPLAMALRAPGEWNYYDIIFKAPRFNKDGILTSPATVTLLMNGVVVQNNVILQGPTEYIGIPHYKAHAEKLPIKLQDHGNPVKFRNIWVREL
ncbi:uncharacterized protein DUF1080 [Algoriphagus ratkowskyi]|uniref:DUF1080 domain-containing protein n=1 Tax=Algoriphagus ratkowskyi TaxID=57028 RepID=A0A2W7RFC2_9BACT|nr:DUF1080 domain-containing protein [Algoriphagus ratkowskyi]PZX57090.1 uncharacterized protein DUF1080 [Algoriphagus ratkowskyi]TXD79984.1 DUF1080 domain-containing protein [Algoriphagus ratkowskyi]